MTNDAVAEEKPPFVLVHGAFHGGWCWRAVAERLRSAGHTVFSPTQTGLGERRHLLSSEITMETFVLDILNVFRFEDLKNVILVGHSFGGRTVGGVADRIPERIRQLIFIDAGLAHEGLSRFDRMSEDAKALRLAVAENFDGGVSVPPPPASHFGVDDPDLAKKIEERLTPHPLGAERTRVTLSSPLGNGLPATFVHCIAPRHAATEASAAYARTRADWHYEEFAGGHSCIMTHPDLVADLLLRRTATVQPFNPCDRSGKAEPSGL